MDTSPWDVIVLDQAHPSLHKYLRHVEPLPANPELQGARELLHSLRAHNRFPEELVHFVGRASTLPKVLRQRALASLESGFEARQSELLVLSGDR
jgi:hypothetical protein